MSIYLGSEADKPHTSGGGQLKARISQDLLLKLLGQRHVVANVFL